MDCILRVINGPDQGREHRLLAGTNLIGRGNRAALRLTPEDVSWEHAVVTCQGDEFYIENLSALGTWVGDAKVTGRVRLKPRDKVRLTRDTVLRMDAADGGGGVFGSRLFLATALVMMVGILVALVFYQGKGPAGDGQDDWPAAYNTLSPWLRTQASRRPPRVAPEAAELFDRAWRLDQAKDYAHALPMWVRLEVVLSGAEAKMKCLQLAGEDKRALQNLLTPPTPDYTPTDEQKAAALAQFVQRRIAFASKVTQKGFLR